MSKKSNLTHEYKGVFYAQKPPPFTQTIPIQMASEKWIRLCSPEVFLSYVL